MANIKCEECGNKTFVSDESRGYEILEPMKPLTIDGHTTFTKIKNYLMCSKCGWEFPHAIDKMGESVTITFEINKPSNEKTI